jgi:hypothetical protein
MVRAPESLLATSRTIAGQRSATSAGHSPSAQLLAAPQRMRVVGSMLPGYLRVTLSIASTGRLMLTIDPPRLRGKLPKAASVTRIFMAGQAHSAVGTAKIITGDMFRQAIWRIDQTEVGPKIRGLMHGQIATTSRRPPRTTPGALPRPADGPRQHAVPSSL